MSAATNNFFNKCQKAALLIFFIFCDAQVFAQRPLGIDVSSYQGSADSPATNIVWTDVKSSGITFAWTKATEGLTVNDADFVFNEGHAAAAGVLIGAYHFAHPETHIGLAGADEEAAHFWNVASNYITGGGYFLMPMLDVESDLSSANPPYTKATLSQWVNEWCQDIVNDAAAHGVTVTPVVYTYTSYATAWLDNTVTNWPLWMAQYPASPNPQIGAPSSTSPWTTWTVWQYDDSGVIPGVTGGCDVDVFNGDRAGLGALIVGGSASPYFSSQPVLSRVVDTGGTVSFSATAGGTPPLNFQWRLNNTSIPDATNSTITINDAQTNDAGNYSVIVTNESGSDVSSIASLTVFPVQTTVFSDDFETNSAANWIVNKSSTDTAVAFNFNYSTLGIPPAPHSVGGIVQHGLQLKANLTQGVVSAISVSPTNEIFSGDSRLHFDAWINVNGPFPGGGASSTEFLTAGIGTAGNRTEWTGSGSTADGFYFSADGDGGVSGTSTTFGDYSGYKGTVWQNAASGIYAAGSLDNGNGYYSTAFPNGAAAPAAQQSNYPQQTGNLSSGTFGLAWHDVIVARRGNTVTWSVDGILFATISNAAFTANNVSVGFWDPFASLTDNTNLSFGLVDNLRVEVPASAPLVLTEPQSQTVKLGTNVTFTVAASGLPAPDFQWQFNGTNILDATNSSFLIANVTATNVGNYSVTVSNIAGSITSSNAALALLPPAPAQFQSIAVQPDGSLQISFTGDAVWNYTVETSTNLTDWSVLTNFTSDDGNFIFNAGATTNSPQQFYRARAGP